MTIACIGHGGITAIGGTIDADRAGCHLTDGHDICKLTGGHPMPMMDYLALNEREHAIAATKAK